MTRRLTTTTTTVLLSVLLGATGCATTKEKKSTGESGAPPTDEAGAPAEASGPARAKYVEQVTSLHQMLVYAMKTKQTTDLGNVEKLRGLMQAFKASYLAE